MALDALRCNHLAPLGFKGLMGKSWITKFGWVYTRVALLPRGKAKKLNNSSVVGIMHGVHYTEQLPR